ncbi:predicted protein [Methanosarcina acetivorans C2A]|uniref:KAP NTPase domain-containing protein n=2 Tax=Methanosarcina acetivorans TaxID=2214 RepID=Q8TI73_METAC|nr:predicted protein [Methanosarcina acetivorans C2A]
MVDDKSNLTSCYMCSDTATGKDSLGFKPYFEAIAEFLTAEETLAPITLSIEGQWGCGKSFFMKQLEEKIEKGNICDISIREFLKYLFLNQKKAELPGLKSLTSKLKTLFLPLRKYSHKIMGASQVINMRFLIHIPSKIK